MIETPQMNVTGFIELWADNPSTGERTLVLSKQNKVLVGAAELMARSAAGDSTATIWGIRFGFANSEPALTGLPDITSSAYTNKFSEYAAPFGSVAAPLLLPGVVTSAQNQSANVTGDGAQLTNNIVRFQATLFATSAEGLVTGAPLTDGVSRLFEVALIANPTLFGSSDNEGVFARTHFRTGGDLSPVLYNASFNLTVIWGIKFVI